MPCTVYPEKPNEQVEIHFLGGGEQEIVGMLKPDSLGASKPTSTVYMLVGILERAGALASIPLRSIQGVKVEAGVLILNCRD